MSKSRASSTSTRPGVWGPRRIPASMNNGMVGRPIRLPRRARTAAARKAPPMASRVSACPTGHHLREHGGAGVSRVTGYVPLARGPSGAGDRLKAADADGCGGGRHGRRGRGSVRSRAGVNRVAAIPAVTSPTARSRPCGSTMPLINIARERASNAQAGLRRTARGRRGRPVPGSRTTFGSFRSVCSWRWCCGLSPGRAMAPPPGSGRSGGFCHGHTYPSAGTIGADTHFPRWSTPTAPARTWVLPPMDTSAHRTQADLDGHGSPAGARAPARRSGRYRW